MIKYSPINANKIRNLIADIQNNIKELSYFASMSPDKFVSDSKNYGLAEHYLRRSLEGILTIGTHILSRLPVKTKDYQEIILGLAKNGIVPEDFAQKNKKLAGYRNRLVHMYWEISKEEIHNVIQQHLKDLDDFCFYFQQVIKEPNKFGLETE